jgi:hypothetical protein
VTADRSPGWDTRAIKAIADEYYGGYAGLNESLGWTGRGNQLMPGTNGRVKNAYGSIEQFIALHPVPKLIDPLTAVNAQQPNVWLKSFYGFSPRNWGFVGFANESNRQSFIRRSKPGALVVVYGASRAPISAERGQILGVLQMSHETGRAKDFMPPEAYAKKQADIAQKDRWDFGIRAVRAWIVTPETSLAVEDFAPQTYSVGAAQTIGRQGMPLTRAEARKLLNFDLVEVPVFGTVSSGFSEISPASTALSPSKPGPVSKKPHARKESEGPKHLYVLQLVGNENHFLGKDAKGMKIIKVGFSASPTTRRDDHNRALPTGAFSWIVLRSTFLDGEGPFPSSDHAKCGENSLKADLDREGDSLGGEFFLASDADIQSAWRRGIEAARTWSAE